MNKPQNLRADAERNREAILEAAREVFSRDGTDASLEEIARRAGVGIATLYRRFPNRTDLIDALFGDKALEYEAASQEALKADDPWSGFVQLMMRIGEMQAADRGFCDVLQASLPKSESVSPHMHRAFLNIQQVVLRAKKSGDLRPDASPPDVFWMMIANAAYIQEMNEASPESWRRYMVVMLDGLRTGSNVDPLPDGASERDVDGAVSRIRARNSANGAT